LEESLGDGFARCNHCYLVNLNFVEGVKEDYVVLGKSHLKISRPKKKAFLQKLSDHYRFGGR
jgi:DNA-binding LytR/AlgR family response regulator